jgi:hypothetical protein
MKKLKQHSVNAILLLLAVACSKGAADAQGSAAPAADGAHADFASRGGDACTKYLTPDVVASIAKAPGGTVKKLSSQSCDYKKDQVTITITLINAPPGAYTAYVTRMHNLQPLSGVGDQAVQSVPLSKLNVLVEVVSQKGADMGCNLQVEGDQPSLKLQGPALGQAMGAICNTIYADAH